MKGGQTIHFFDLGIAFMIGLLGGIHCVGMCGGIVAALSMGRKSAWWKGITLYHLGRVLSYSGIGLLAGLAGNIFTGSLNIAVAQQLLSVTAGLMMIFFALQIGGFIPEKLFGLSIMRIPSFLLKRAVAGDSSTFWGVVGIFNGLLPCGMVYAALSLALKQADPLSGAFIMLSFGLGTIPAMTILALVIKRWDPELRGRLLRWAALFLILFGCFTLLRGFFTDLSHHKHHGVANEEMLDIR